MSDRARLEAQTRRNLEGMELERAGRVDEAVALYEQNLAEGFAGDWPYARLVAIYTARGRSDEVVRVLERGLEVLRRSRARSASDRRALRRVFEARLQEVQQALARQQGRPAEGPPPAEPGR